MPKTARWLDIFRWPCWKYNIILQALKKITRAQLGETNQWRYIKNSVIILSEAWRLSFAIMMKVRQNKFDDQESDAILPFLYVHYSHLSRELMHVCVCVRSYLCVVPWLQLTGNPRIFANHLTNPASAKRVWRQVGQTAWVECCSCHSSSNWASPSNKNWIRYLERFAHFFTVGFFCTKVDSEQVSYQSP